MTLSSIPETRRKRNDVVPQSQLKNSWFISLFSITLVLGYNPPFPEGRVTRVPDIQSLHHKPAWPSTRLQHTSSTFFVALGRRWQWRVHPAVAFAVASIAHHGQAAHALEAFVPAYQTESPNA